MAEGALLRRTLDILFPPLDRVGALFLCDTGGDYVEAGSLPDPEISAINWHEDTHTWGVWYALSILTSAVTVEQAPLIVRDRSWHPVSVAGEAGTIIFRDVKAQHRGSANFTDRPRALPCYRFARRRPETNGWAAHVGGVLCGRCRVRSAGAGPFLARRDRLSRLAEAARGQGIGTVEDNNYCATNFFKRSKQCYEIIYLL